jgi:hypothetical protein
MTFDPEDHERNGGHCEPNDPKQGVDEVKVKVILSYP